MQFQNSATSAGVLERDFLVGEVPGVLWSPEIPRERSPLVLMGHGGGLHKKTPAQKARAVEYVTRWGFAVAAIDAPGHGERPRSPEDDQARTDMRAAMSTGDKERFKTVSIEYTRSLTERAVPEWQATIDALQQLPQIGPIAYGGGISLGTAIGIPLTAADPRIEAAVFGGGFFVYDTLLEAARRITVPVQFLLPWDDEHVTRESSLSLFDAFATKEKTLHANPGDHRTVRWTGIDPAFLARHLGAAA